jgi:hypothetical protein
MRSEELCSLPSSSFFQLLSEVEEKSRCFVFESSIAEVVAAKVGGVGTTT